jgi:hypothetical protein
MPFRIIDRRWILPNCLGAALAGAAAAIALRLAPVRVVAVAMACGMVGGIIPKVGFFAGFGAIIGIAVGHVACGVFSVTPEESWNFFIPAGVLCGIGLWVIRLTARSVMVSRSTREGGRWWR